MANLLEPPNRQSAPDVKPLRKACPMARLMQAIAEGADHLRHLPVLFWAAAALVFSLCIVGSIDSVQFKTIVDTVNSQIYHWFGGFYLWFTWLCLLAFVAIGLSPLGKIRLGGAEAVPEHSFTSWFAMLFCAGMGTGFMFWGAAEPLYHFMNPPLTDVQTLAQMKTLAFRYTFFHWGFHPWAIYGMTALAIGFFGFNLQKGFYFSSFLSKGKQAESSKLQIAIDFITILAILFGIAATIGMGVLQLAGGFKAYFHLANTPGTTLTILGVCTAAYLLSTLKGLDKGIKVLSNVNLWLSVLLMAAIFAVGNESDIWDVLGNTLTAYITHIPAMSLGMGSFHDPAWVGDWTVKYWSWWIAWAPFVGLFIAFISKGRTIRELVLGVLVAPTLFSCLWFTILGDAAINLQQAQHYSGDHLNLAHVDGILFSLLDRLSHAPYLGWFSLTLVAINFINSADSATYTISCLSARDLDREPPARLQLAWGVLFATVAGLLLLTGGIDILQQVTTITVLPFTLLLAAIFVSLMIALIRYKPSSVSRSLKAAKTGL